MSQRYKTERLIITSKHCNPNLFLHGRVTGTTILFNDGSVSYMFVSAPDISLTPWSAVGGATCSGISLDVDENGYYIGATIEMNADFVVWTAIGVGIEVPSEE